MGHFSFLLHFLKDYRVGAIVKSSPFTIKKICEKIDCSGDIIIVEYGPGDGIITKALLAKITLNSKIIAIETNKSFVDKLKTINDKRLMVIHDNAENIPDILDGLGIKKADYIISGIPFTFIAPNVKKQLITNTKDVLAPGGRFIVYQYTPVMSKYIKPEFGNVRIGFVPLNMPSYFLMEAVKAGPADDFHR